MLAILNSLVKLTCAINVLCVEIKMQLDLVFANLLVIFIAILMIKSKDLLLVYFID